MINTRTVSWQRLNMVVFYNDHISPLIAKNGHEPFGEIKMESGERLPVLYIFNEPVLGALRARALIQHLLVQKNWIVFAPVSKQSEVISALRDHLGRSMQLMRPRLHESDRQVWDRILGQKISAMAVFRARIRYQFIKVLLPKPQEAKERESSIYKGPRQWRRPAQLLALILAILALLYFAEKRFQLVSIYSGQPIQILTSSDEWNGNVSEIWQKEFLEKLEAYAPDEKFTRDQRATTELLQEVKRDRLRIGFTTIPLTLDNRLEYGWSEPYVETGMVLVQKILPDAAQPLSLTNLGHFVSTVGYAYYAGTRPDTTMERRLRNDLRMRGVSLQKFINAPILLLRLFERRLDLVVLDSRTISDLRTAWDRDYLPRLIELSRVQGNLDTSMVRVWGRQFRFFIRQELSPATALRQLRGTVGLVRIGSDARLTALLNKGLDTTHVRLQVNRHPEQLLQRVQRGELVAVLVNALEFERIASRYPALRVTSPLLSNELYALMFHPSHVELKVKLDNAIATLSYQAGKDPKRFPLFQDIYNNAQERIIDWFPVSR